MEGDMARAPSARRAVDGDGCAGTGKLRAGFVEYGRNPDEAYKKLIATLVKRLPKDTCTGKCERKSESCVPLIDLKKLDEDIVREVFPDDDGDPKYICKALLPVAFHCECC